MTHELIAAVDLGSNSFRLQIGRVEGDQIYLQDSLKESVRLAAGLDDRHNLSDTAISRAIEALLRFHERLNGFAPSSVRVVGTNTLRVAKNKAHFLRLAEAALGFPIEIIAGREEARLIYLGVAHSLADPHHQQLVVDIGGGSTEVIIGKSFSPRLLESLHMGCITYSQRFFPDGKIDKARFRQAETAARQEIQTIAHAYKKAGWDVAFGSSGTARTLCDIMTQNNLTKQGISQDGISELKSRLIKAGHASRLNMAGLRQDRMFIFPGGLAIMSAIFKTFSLKKMKFSEGALRQGVLYDLLGRHHNEDLRNATVEVFMKRYKVDTRHAHNVMRTALRFLHEIMPRKDNAESPLKSVLQWAAKLHEIGISVAHSSFHKHSAYILANADMPGFSQMDQARLAAIVLSHRGKLSRALNIGISGDDWTLLICLRLAALLHRSRSRCHSEVPVALKRKEDSSGFVIRIPADWLRDFPLTAAALAEEAQNWMTMPQSLDILTIKQAAA